MRGIRDDDIAIIGYAFELPDGIDTNDKFWELMENGQDAIKEIPKDRWDWKKIYDPDPDAEGKSYSYHGGFLKDIQKFDANAFRIMPIECKNIDPQQRIALKTSWLAMENSFLDIESLKHSNIGVFMGATMDDYTQLQTRVDGGRRINRYTHFGGVLNNIAGRISFVFGFNGPSLTIDTACSSSLTAVDSAIKAIHEGDCKIALAGGVNVILNEEMYIKFSRTQMLSKTGKCKTFDDSADGYVRSEGCGVVVLMKYSQAIQSGKKILAIIRGCSVNHNGNSGALTVPSGRAQAMLINNCMGKAGVDIEDIDYVEAHGTGTQLGDKIEVNALQDVFRERKNPLLIGSVKTNLGHLESAAGITGLIKVLLCMEHNTIVKTVDINEKNHKINWDNSVIEVAENNITWESENKIAGVSSFGASGTNAHIILQKYDNNIINENMNYTDEGFAIAISAKSTKSLYNLLKSVYSYIKDKNDNELRKICKTYNVCRSHYKNRCSVYGKDSSEFLENFKEKIEYFSFEGKKSLLDELYIYDNIFDKTDYIENLLKSSVSFAKIFESYSNLFDFNAVPSESKDEVNKIVVIASLYKFLLEIGYKKIKFVGDNNFNLAKLFVEKTPQLNIDKILDLLTDNCKDCNKLDDEGFISNENAENSLSVEDIGEESIYNFLLKQAVEQYEAGVNIQWKMFYNDLKVDVDFLPSYIFDGQDYWIDYQRHCSDELSTINPFSSYIETINDISDEKSFIWDIVLKENSELVNEHILNGKKILVGMFQIQLISELLKQKSVLNCSISDLFFLQKIQIPKNKKLRVKIDILQDNNYKGDIRCKNAEDNKWVTKTQFNVTEAKYIKENDDFDSFFDDVEFIETDQFYETLNDAGLNLGSHFKILDSIIYSSNTVSANIDNSVFIPAVLDAASQLIYLFREDNDKGLYLPYNFKEFIQYGSLNLVNRVETELIERKKNELIARLTYYKDEEIIAQYNECHLIKVNPTEKASIQDIAGLPVKLPTGVDLYNNIIKVIGTSLNDHAVYKRLTIPGAYYISQIMELAEQEYVGKVFSLSDVSFYNAVVLSDDEKVRELIQVEKDDKGYNAVVYSSATSNHNYLQNAKLHIDSNDGHIASERILEDVKFDSHYTKDEILDIQRRIGLHLGKTFNWMQEVWINDDTIKARIQNDNFVTLVNDYGTPPGLIDTSVQILGLIKNITQFDKGAYIPLSIGKITKYSDFQDSMWCIAKLIREKGEVIVGDITFYDNSQRNKILEINDLSLIKADAKKLGKISETDNLLFNENWKKIDISNLEYNDNKQLIEIRFGINTKKIVFSIYGISDNNLNVMQKEIVDCFAPESILECLKRYSSSDKENIIIISNSEVNSIENVSINELNIRSFELTKVYLQILKTIEDLELPNSKICVITNCLHKIDDKSITNNFGSSIIWGLFRSIQIEATNIDLTLIDIDFRWQNKFDRILSIINYEKNQFCIRNNEVYTPVIQRENIVSISKKNLFDTEKWFVVFGGFGALGYETCKWLINNGIEKLIIIGRSQLEEKQEMLDDLLSINKVLECEYLQSDVTSEEAYYKIKSLLENKQALGGIFYAVGSVVDKYHTNYKDEDIQQVYSSKISGTYILSKILTELDFDFCVCYSSIVGVLGAAGQSVYGASNCFQDYICNFMKEKDKNMFTVQWGPWGQIGMFSKVSKIGIERYTKRNIDTLTIEQAVSGLEMVLYSQKNTMVSNMLLKKTPSMVPTSSQRINNKDLDSCLDLSVKDRLKQIIASGMGITEFSSLDDNISFFDMGIDSLLMVDLRIKINKTFGVNLPMDIFFDDINISILVDKISVES